MSLLSAQDSRDEQGHNDTAGPTHLMIVTGNTGCKAMFQKAPVPSWNVTSLETCCFFSV